MQGLQARTCTNEPSDGSEDEDRELEEGQTTPSWTAPRKSSTGETPWLEPGAFDNGICVLHLKSLPRTVEIRLVAAWTTGAAGRSN